MEITKKVVFTDLIKASVKQMVTATLISYALPFLIQTFSRNYGDFNVNLADYAGYITFGIGLLATIIANAVILFYNKISHKVERVQKQQEEATKKAEERKQARLEKSKVYTFNKEEYAKLLEDKEDIEVLKKERDTLLAENTKLKDEKTKSDTNLVAQIGSMRFTEIANHKNPYGK
jgi:hypothetical protein